MIPLVLLYTPADLILSGVVGALIGAVAVFAILVYLAWRVTIPKNKNNTTPKERDLLPFGTSKKEGVI